MGIFSTELTVREIETNLNNLIKQIKFQGGSIYLVDKTNPNISIKLDREFGICFYVDNNQ